VINDTNFRQMGFAYDANKRQIKVVTGAPSGLTVTVPQR